MPLRSAPRPPGWFCSWMASGFTFRSPILTRGFQNALTTVRNGVKLFFIRKGSRAPKRQPDLEPRLVASLSLPGARVFPSLKWP